MDRDDRHVVEEHHVGVVREHESGGSCARPHECSILLTGPGCLCQDETAIEGRIRLAVSWNGILTGLRKGACCR